MQDTNPLMGLDTYGGQFSRPAGAAANNLYNLADFMFGARSQYELATLTVAEMRQRFHFAFIQGDWKVTRKLTLNLGLRYEFGTPYWGKENRLSNYDPVTNSIVLARDGSLYDRGLVDPDYNNFGPRLGFAYNIFDKTVIRGGYAKGFAFMNRLGSADILGTNFPIVTRAAVAQSPTSPLCAGDVFQPNCFRPTQSGYPTSGLPNNVTLHIPRDRPTASIQNWQLSVQRELFWDFVLDVAYVGNRADDTVLLADLNQARPVTQAEWAAFQASPSTPLPSLDSRRPIPGFGSISAVLPEGFSTYNALLEKRFSKGLYLLNSFTWSKAIDNGSQVLEEPNGNTGTPQNVNNFRADKGIGAYDQPFNNTTGFVWEVPVGRNRWLSGGMHPILDAFIGGWTLNGINTMTSGAPINFRYALTGAAAITSNLPSFLGGVALRPNVSCDPINRGDRPNPTRDYFNASCFSRPAPFSPFGNAARNIARSDSYFNFDLGLHKQFRLPITDVTRLEFRAEFFNLFNKTNFQAANSDAGQLVFNSSGVLTGTGSFGVITSAYPARQIQLAAKFTF